MNEWHLKKKKNSTLEEIKGLVYFVFGLLLFTTFLYKPYKIPTGSMIPTLLVGDFLIVDKFCYGYSRYSLPFGLPLFSGRIGFSKPKCGEVVVFNNPKDEGKDYIKRLIGLPGDKVQVINGVVHINDKSATLKKIEDFTHIDKDSKTFSVPQYTETLPNGVEHPIIKFLPFGEATKDNFGPFVVPAGHYFFMGDNRDNSKDSRFEEVGAMPEENLVGQAKFIFFSTTANWYEPWEWPFGMRFRQQIIN